MNIQIRKGEKKDLPDVLRLVHELADFEKAPDAVTNTVEDMQRDGFRNKPCLQFFTLQRWMEKLLVWHYTCKYSTWKGKRIIFDDLFVSEKYRGKGIGKKLFDALWKKQN